MPITPFEMPPVFGRYRILRPLGRGGMGVVYLAEDSQLGRQVALKVPRFTIDDSPEIIDRFYREARVAAGIHHPNVCGVHDVGAIDGIPYLTMPYIDGAPLSRRLGQAWPPREAVALVAHLASILAELHTQKVMHRDLKPSNILMRSDGEPVLMDFGLARSVTGHDRMTASGATVGTPAYMSPEQCVGDHRQVGPATDIFSLGLILYELLTGALPFQGKGQFVCFRLPHDRLPPPSAARPGLDAELDAICLKALAYRPKDRYASMTEFAAALETWNRRWEQSTVSVLRPQPAPAATPATAAIVPTPAPLTLAGAAGVATEPVVARAPFLPHLRRAATLGLVAVLAVLAVCFFGVLVQSLATLHIQPAPPPVTNSLGMRLLPVPAGSFVMGSTADDDAVGSNELPQHRATIGRPFHLAARKTTQAEFERLMGRNPSEFSSRGAGKDKVRQLDTADFPVENVSYFDAVEFCNKLSEQEGRKPCYVLAGGKSAQSKLLPDGTGYRLPTEAEWEYCARAGTSTRFSFGNDPARLAEHAWFDGNSGGRTHAVGQKPANPWGLHDLGGLLWEWCEDAWHETYEGAPADGTAWLAGGDPARRVVRGGSWDYNAWSCRCAYRSKAAVRERNHRLGFRVVLASP